MINTEIMNIINEEIANSAVADKQHVITQITQHGNGYTVCVRVGELSQLSGVVEYSHPGYTANVYGIAGESSIRSRLRQYLARFA